MGKFEPPQKASPPAYMVSFCDMMTLILTFFILLVSMSQKQQVGLMAAGLGSFIVAVKSHGLNGVLTGQEKADVFQYVRRKFNVPYDVEEDRLTDVADASNLELIRTRLLHALEPHSELHYPAVVEFDDGSALIGEKGTSYLDLLAPSLQPKHRQTLLIEGHANDAGPEFGGNNRQLATARAIFIKGYLVEKYGFAPERVEARAWHQEVPTGGQKNQSVDIRLLTPGAETADN
jgi:outer membrane protein OmpA-like peptidoglycan-associated protein